MNDDLHETKAPPVVSKCTQAVIDVGDSIKGLSYPEQLRKIEEQIRNADPDNSDLWLYVAERMSYIINNQELLKASGCRSEHQYVCLAMNRLGLHPESARLYLKAYRTYRNYESYFRAFDMDIGGNRENLVNAGLFTKFQYLEQAINIRHRRIDATYSMDDVFTHFFVDSLREFKNFIDPELTKRERWRDHLRLRNTTIQKTFEKNEQVHLVSYVPTKSLDKVRLAAIIDAALNEADNDDD